METLQIPDLFARRSIRRFRPEPVKVGQVELLLKAAMAAPSAANRQPWHFVVVTDMGTRSALGASHPYAKMLGEAPLCIVPCGEPGLSIPDRNEYWIQDVAAATENLLLAAVGLGLGAVWCGVYPVEERVEATRRILGIPDTVVPFAYVAVGHPAEERPARTQYQPTRVHWERW